ncbi:YueH family protein [Bacillus xiapuensis]|uniref:YueH family protein n=1 Tax=Bacillus xiapuensis TaxID=2014075 RepID=UPI000C2355A1|nr:YueH family protein [Bacillus xiapuensis]
MKIRKTILNDEETKVYIYENKKEEIFVVAVPVQQWSCSFTYEDGGERFIEQLSSSLKRTGLEESAAETLARRINQWTREM